MGQLEIQMNKRKILLGAAIVVVTALIVFGVLWAVSNFQGDKATQGSKWTVMVYMVGSDLETDAGAATANIDEMIEGLGQATTGKGDVSVVIETGGAKAWRGHNIPADKLSRLAVTKTGVEPIEELENVSMGAPETLGSFVQWGRTTYPAENTALVIWNHGAGSVDGVAFDDLFDGDSLKMSEITSVLEKSQSQFDKKFAIIGFDACLMADLEVATALEPYANYLAASQEVEGTSGWDYKTWLAKLVNDSDETGDIVATNIATSYAEKAKSGSQKERLTSSAIDLSKVKAIDEEFEQGTTDLNDLIQKAKNSERYGGSDDTEGYSNLIDIAPFVSENVIKDAVIFNAQGEAHPKASGVSVFYPVEQVGEKLSSVLEQYQNEYPTSNYAKFITDSFANPPEDLIQLDNLGSVNNKGVYQISLADDGLEFVDFVEVEVTNDKGEILGRLPAYPASESAPNRFVSPFDNTWFAMNGQFLNTTPVNRSEGNVVYTSPIVLNSKMTNLRFSWSAGTGQFQIIGAWSGLDASGASDRDATPLLSGDTITPISVKDSDEEDLGRLPRDIKLTADQFGIKMQHLPKGKYTVAFVVTDLFGREFWGKPTTIIGK